MSSALDSPACFVTCSDHIECATVCEEAHIQAPFPTINLLATVVLVVLSGMFSGLTLGLLSLSLEGLDIIIVGGSSDERRWAARIYPVRKRGNHLLCTLLFGNTLVSHQPPHTSITLSITHPLTNPLTHSPTHPLTHTHLLSPSGEQNLIRPISSRI